MSGTAIKISSIGFRKISGGKNPLNGINQRTTRKKQKGKKPLFLVATPRHFSFPVKEIVIDVK